MPKPRPSPEAYVGATLDAYALRPNFGSPEDGFFRLLTVAGPCCTNSRGLCGHSHAR